MHSSIRRHAAIVAAGLFAAFAAPVPARTLEEILQEKGVIDSSEANEAKAAKEKEQAATEKIVSSIPTLPDWLKMVTLFGDVRIRNESFFQDGTSDRIRQRFRLRFGAKVKPTDEIETGFKLASGNANDPISNNQTFTDEFTFKNINIANAYIKLTPYKSIGLDRPWVTLMGGKFDQPFYVPPTPNQLVFDPDLTPEGFFETLKAVDEKEGFLRTVALNLGQFIFQENSNTGEAAIYGFQGLFTMAFGEAVFNIAPADYYYVDPSSIAVARNTNNQLNISNFVQLSDGEIVGGTPIDLSKAGPNQNGMTSPTVDPVTGQTIPGQPITITRLINPFNEVDIPMDILIPTGMPSWPVRLYGDYVINTDSRGSSANRGYQGGFTIGSYKDPCDFFFSYAYESLETDAVISAFTNSDFGRNGGTNTKANMLQAGYVLTKNFSLLSTAWIDKPVVNVPGRNSNTDVRWQVDAITKF
jgi:Putative porin